MMSGRCVCWCATCDRHTHEKHIYVYILLVRICPHARTHCGFDTGENESSTARSKLHTKRGKNQSLYPFLFETQQSIFRLSRVVCFMAVRKRFAGDPTQLPQLLAAHITSPTCAENCADRKHAQKRIVKHADLLLDLRALWPKLYILPIDHDRARETEKAR